MCYYVGSFCIAHLEPIPDTTMIARCTAISNPDANPDWCDASGTGTGANGFERMPVHRLLVKMTFCEFCSVMYPETYAAIEHEMVVIDDPDGRSQLQQA